MSTEYLDSSGLETLWTQIRAADAAVLTSANNDRTIIETYNLPSLTASSSTSYDILTSKSAVTIAQGGTGATSASAARTNLAVLGTAGGTMTGTITHKHSSWDVTSPPSSDSSWDIHYVTDKNDKGITFHRIWNKTTNGVMGYEFGVRRQGSSAGTTTLWNTITLDVSADGTRSVGVSDAAAWRAALGLGSNATSSTAYLPLAGGTMTGTLKGTYIQATNYYQTWSDGGQFVINARTSNGSSHRGQMSITSDNRWYWCEYGTSGTDSTREYYYLPKSTATSGSPEYNILTSKTAVTVAQGGTGATTFTSGNALIGNGTGAITTRGITNLTEKGYIPYSSTNLITVNALAFWDGSYNSSGSSNISHVGTITSGTWQGTAIASAYIGSHTHSYLPLSGGTITGQVVVQGAADSIAATHGVSCDDYADSYFKKRMNAAAFLVGGHTTDDKFRGGLAMNSTNNRVYFRAHKTSGNARGDIFQFPAPTNTSTSSDVTYFIPIMQYGYAAANTSTNITLNRTGTWLMITGHNSTAGSNELYIVRTGANIFKVSGGTSSTMTSISISNATITLKSSNAINIYFIFLAHGTND